MNYEEPKMEVILFEGEDVYTDLQVSATGDGDSMDW